MSICLALICVLSGCAHVTEQAVPGTDSKLPPPLLIRFYRGPLNCLAAVRRGECPMTPSCSEFSRRVFEKHGPLIGWMMTVDRLLRCGRDEVDLAPRIRIAGRWKSLDSVENNDFWWATTRPFENPPAPLQSVSSP